MKPVLVRITNNLGMGGVQRRLRDLLPRLAEHFEVHAITYKDQGVFFHELQDLGVHTHFLPRGRAAHLTYARFLHRLGPSIVHTHSYGGNTLGLLAARLAGVPVRIGHVHSTHLHWYAPSPWRRHLQARKEALVHRLCTHRVCCVSREAREAFLAGTGLDPSLVVVLENGIARPPQDIRALPRPAMDVPADALLVGMAGRLHSSKGMDEAISWLATTPDHVHLAVAGPGDQRALRHHAQCRGVGHRVHFLGPVQDMPAFYAALDLLLFPSPPGVEGMPGVVLEALGMGLAVLARQTRPLEEIAPVAPRLVFFQEDQPVFPQILQALNAPPANHAAFWARFSLEAMLERTLHLYAELLGARGGRT